MILEQSQFLKTILEYLKAFYNIRENLKKVQNNSSIKHFRIFKSLYINLDIRNVQQNCWPI